MDDENKPKRKAKGAVLVLAILNFIFGGMGLLGSCGVFFMGVFMKSASFKSAMPPAMRGDPSLELMSHPVYQGILFVGFLVSIAMLVIGFMLIKLIPAGRKMALYLAGFQLVQWLAGIVINLTVFLPFMRDGWAKMPHGPPPGAETNFFVGIIIGSVTGAIYPAVVLFFLTRDEAKQQFEDDDELAEEFD